MIREIIDKFVVRKLQKRGYASRETSVNCDDESKGEPTDGTVEREVKENRSLTSATQSKSSSAMTVEIGRERLIALLKRSQIDNFSVPLGLLEQLDWKLPTDVAPKTDTVVSTSYERKFDEASIVIDPIDYDDSDDDVRLEEDCQPSPKKQKLSHPENNTPILATAQLKTKQTLKQPRKLGSGKETKKMKTLRLKKKLESLAPNPEELHSLSFDSMQEKSIASPSPQQLESTPLVSNKKPPRTELPKSLKLDITSGGYRPTEPVETSPEEPSFSTPPRTAGEADTASPTQSDMEEEELLVVQRSLSEKGSVITTPERQSTRQTKTKPPKTKSDRLLRQLGTNLNPGILTVCHKPKVFPLQMQLRQNQRQEYTSLLTQLLFVEMPENAAEMPLQLANSESLKKRFPNCIMDPTRVERGYYKTHLSSEFVNSFASYMPECVRIKRNVSKKGIAFISTVAATLSDTHYDQDTSFLLLLAGTKEVFYAPPSMGDRLRVDHPVLSHSSIFEDVNPFVAATGTLWEFATLNAGDGLLLPQGWIHAIKSIPGTVAISFQVESSGIDATSPYLRRARATDPEDLRHLSHIVVNMAETEEATYKDVIVSKKSALSTAKPEVAKPTVAKRAPRRYRKEGFGNRVQSTLVSKQARLPSGVFAKKITLAPPSNSSSPSTKLPSVSRVSAVLNKVVSTILPTRKQDQPQPAAPHWVRRSRREKLGCGVDGCKNTFPVDDGLMWVMVLALESCNNGTTMDCDLPVVPTHHPKHMICLDCRELKGFAVFSPDEVLTEEDKDGIKDWDQYMYYTASRADYQKWANHSGESGQLHLKY